MVSISWKDYFLISDYVVSVCGEKALCAVFASFHLEVDGKSVVDGKLKGQLSFAPSC